MRSSNSPPAVQDAAHPAALCSPSRDSAAVQGRAAPQPPAATQPPAPGPDVPLGRFRPFLSPVCVGRLLCWERRVRQGHGRTGAPGTRPHPHATSCAGADAAGQPGHPPPPDKIPFPLLASPRGHPGCLVQAHVELPDDSRSSRSTTGTSHPCPPAAGALLPGSCCSCCKGREVQRATFPPPLTWGQGNAASELYRAVPQAFWVPVEEFRGTLVLSLAATCCVLGA